MSLPYCPGQPSRQEVAIIYNGATAAQRKILGDRLTEAHRARFGADSIFQTLRGNDAHAYLAANPEFIAWMVSGSNTCEWRDSDMDMVRIYAEMRQHAYERGMVGPTVSSEGSAQNAPGAGTVKTGDSEFEQVKKGTTDALRQAGGSIWDNIKTTAGNIVNATVGGAVGGAQASTSGAAAGSGASGFLFGPMGAVLLLVLVLILIMRK